ncbi:MAG: hypothetical protein K2X87_14130 [Gemmataceae bacterium]|nr:hypothetical protein [Gemmataceae bacterium]
MELTATPRTDGETFTLTAEDGRHDLVARRLNAVKRLTVHPPVADEKAVVTAITAKALGYKDAADRPAVVVFVEMDLPC